MKLSVKSSIQEKVKEAVDNTVKSIATYDSFNRTKNVNFQTKTTEKDKFQNKNQSHLFTSRINKKSFFNSSSNSLASSPKLNFNLKSQTIDHGSEHKLTKGVIGFNNHFNIENIESIPYIQDNYNLPSFGKCDITCPNLAKLSKYETIIKGLVEEVEKLKKINKFFLISFGRKNDNLITLLNHNHNLANELHWASSTKREYDFPIYNSISNEPDKKQFPSIKNIVEVKADINNSPITKNNETNSPNALPSTFNSKSLISDIKNKTDLDSTKKSKFLPKMTFKKPEENKSDKETDTSAANSKPSSLVDKTLEKTITKSTSNSLSGLIKGVNLSIAQKEHTQLYNSSNKTFYSSGTGNTTLIKSKKNKSNSHYDNILDMFNKKTRKESIRDTRTSFLTVSNNVLSKIISQDSIREIMKLTNNDDEFLYSMRTYPDDKLIHFSDSIGTLIKDYDYSINLIKRIKSFLQVSIRVVNTLILEDAIDMIIRNSCEVLVCDRTSIYVHDKFSNMLIIHAGEGLKKGQIKIPCDKGIVGHVFLTGERQKIDDVYLDERFNKDIDKQTGYRTRSMICVPLKDEDGKPFGVIQGINKKNGQLFSSDDEELIEIFANQASSILKNSMMYDENLSFISRLKMLLTFSTEISKCNTLWEFSNSAESLLASFWSTNVAQVNVYVDSEKALKCYTSEDEYLIKPTNLGLIGKVFVKREMLAINSGFDSPFFNNIVDLETGYSLVTFPIFDYKEERKLMSICQFGYPLKISTFSQRPRDIDMDVINFFSSICSLWLTEYFKKLP